MNHEQSALWQRIREFELDDPSASLNFTARLARENGWSRGFAHRVVVEYKRFVFLAMVAGHEVTPSELVDEAWHLHLTYTHSYWLGLCRDVLGKRLHHVPTRGGASDAARHLDQYLRTLEAYRTWFGQAAPPDIWPAPAIRFGDDLQHVRVNRSRAWIVPKPHLWKSPRRLAPWIAAASIPPVLWGVANPLDLQGPQFLAFYVTISVFAIAVAFALRQWLRQEEPPSDERELEPHEIACLGRGSAGVLQSCLAGLVTEQKLEVVEKSPAKIGPIPLGSTSYKLRAAVPPEQGASDVERVMLTAAGPQGNDPAEILKAAKTLAEAVESELQSRGLLESKANFGPAFWWPIMILGGVWLLGLAKLCVGFWRDKPVAFLVVCLFALAIVIFFFAKRPFRTRRGEQLFEALKLKYDKLKSINLADSPSVGFTDVMLVAGLFGLTAVDHPQVRQLHSALKPVHSSDGGFASGCGGGDGGGGCGGGGCGGCGGGD